jgi:hypothetical protein
MFKRNNVWLGAVLGLILPGAGSLIAEYLKRNVEALSKADLLYIGCVALNLLLVRYYTRTYREDTARGIIGSTFICAMIFFFYKVRQ